QPSTPPPDFSRPKGPNANLGSAALGFWQILAFFVLAVALVALVVGLAWLWNRYYHPDPDALARGSGRPPGAARVGDLPPSLQVDTDDPWGLAARLRTQGNFKDAVICVFVHQMLTLARLGLIRPAPGRTPRQLVRSVEDRAVRGLV